MEKKLSGKTAIVTGASSGIGASIARLFAREGARVVLFARRQALLEELAGEIRAGGGHCLPVAGDVTDGDDCARLVRAAVETFGGMDILVNNAGAGDYHTTTVDCEDPFWDRMIALNQTAVFRLSREALRVMERQGSGTIVNVSAIAGVYGNAGVAYSSAKAAVNAMTKNIAIQYAGRGIRCNAICPGPTKVDKMVDGSEDHLYNRDFQEITERHMDMTIPFAEVEDQAKVALFLASDDSRCINGQAIVTDGGMCL